MKVHEIFGLCPCPKCRGRNIELRSNARNYFQIKCLDCGAKTRYGKKVEVVIDWFNCNLAKRTRKEAL